MTLKIIIYRKLEELNYNTADIQVVVTSSEEEEELTLKDMKGTILAVSIPQHSADVLMNSRSEEEEFSSLSGEMACLQKLYMHRRMK